MAVVVAEATCEGERVSRRLSLPGTVSKFVPLTVTAVPDAAVVGLKPVTVGVVAIVTSNGVRLVPVIVLTVTVIVPSDALAGTVVGICVSVAADTTALVPLNFTTFCDGT